MIFFFFFFFNYSWHLIIKNKLAYGIRLRAKMNWSLTFGVKLWHWAPIIFIWYGSKEHFIHHSREWLQNWLNIQTFLSFTVQLNFGQSSFFGMTDFNCHCWTMAIIVKPRRFLTAHAILISGKFKIMYNYIFFSLVLLLLMATSANYWSTIWSPPQMHHLISGPISCYVAGIKIKEGIFLFIVETLKIMILWKALPQQNS